MMHIKPKMRVYYHVQLAYQLIVYAYYRYYRYFGLVKAKA